MNHVNIVTAKLNLMWRLKYIEMLNQKTNQKICTQNANKSYDNLKHKLELVNYKLHNIRNINIIKYYF